MTKTDHDDSGIDIGDVIKLLGPTPPDKRPPTAAEFREMIASLIASHTRLEGRMERLEEALGERSDRETQRYLSVQEAAQRLGCTDRTVRNMLDGGRLLGFKQRDVKQGRWRVDINSVERHRA